MLKKNFSLHINNKSKTNFEQTMFHNLTRIILLVLFYSVCFSIYLIVKLKSTNQWPIESNQVSRIDWHDYKFIDQEKLRNGIGENGSEAKLPKTLEILKDALFKENGFNAALSDLISINRSVPDIRHKK